MYSISQKQIAVTLYIVTTFQPMMYDDVQVSKKNLMEIVKKLMLHMDKAEGSHYRDELLSKIIEICSQSNYQYITNFEWYVTPLTGSSYCDFFAGKR